MAVAGLERVRIGCDVGGTFTDVTIIQESEPAATFKAPTTSEDGGVGGLIAALEIAAGDRGIADLLQDCDAFVHSTTLALNAVLQRSVPRTAFITTKGHRDILLLREGGKSEPLNLHIPYPEPLVPRSLSFVVDERVGAQGEVIVPLDGASVDDVLAAIAAADIEAIAVCLLWSIGNPAHELEVGRRIEVDLPGVPYSLSHQVNPILREFRRASSTVIDASLKPIMQAHLGVVEEALRSLGLRGEFLTVTNAGGVISADEARVRPVQVVNSGPSVAPVAARSAVNGQVDVALPEFLIVIDGGGTSLDMSIVRSGEIPLTSEYWLGDRFSGVMLGVPAVNVHSIGAGGGSIAAVDSAGVLRVGPKSAGASPGPACYAKGGTEPTVTDAALVLGLLDAEQFLGGRMELSADLARQAIHDAVAVPLGLTIEESAAAIMKVSDAKVVDLIRERTVREGLDPRQALIVAGGGSSGFSIDRIRAELECMGVFYPRVAPVLASYGAAVSDLVTDHRQSTFATNWHFDHDKVRAALDELLDRSRATPGRIGSGSSDAIRDWYVSARYAYQVWDIEVGFQVEEVLTPEGLGRLTERFHDEHARLFGVCDRSAEVEFVSWRLRTTRPTSSSEGAWSASLRGSRSARRIMIPDVGEVEAEIVPLEALEVAAEVRGPAILRGDYATLVVGPGSVAVRQASGGVLIRAIEESL